MFIIAITISIFEIIVLFFGALILGITIYYFIKTNRALSQTFEAQSGSLQPQQLKKPARPILPANNEKDIFILHEQLKDINKKNTELARPPVQVAPTIAVKKEISNEDLTNSLKATIAQQQSLLNGFLKQVEEIESEGKQKMELENEELQKEINELEKKLEKKNAEMQEMKGQMSTALKMTEKIEEVYKEFEQMQSKMLSLEKLANRSNSLQMELEDTRQSYEQVYNDLVRKSERLEESMKQNQKMKQDLDSLEDKLAEANLQRQQLQKKVQFLQDMNSDMQSMTETNKKLQTELRRIGELESMLNMIAEERDHLLHKKS